MKKVGILTALTSLLSITLVAAQKTNFEIWGETAAAHIANFFDTLQLDPTSFSTILLGMLLWIVLYVVLKKTGIFKESAWWAGAVALIVTILTFIYMPSGYIEAIVQEYAAMGGTILVIIPFIIIGYFTVLTEEANLFTAKAVWLVFAIYFLSLWAYKWGLATSAGFTEYLPYLVAFIIGIVMFWAVGLFRDWSQRARTESLEEGAETRVERTGSAIDAANKLLQEVAGTR